MRKRYIGLFAGITAVLIILVLAGCDPLNTAQPAASPQPEVSPPPKDFDTLRAAGNRQPEGIWSNGTTMWVADSTDEKIFAYSMSTKERTP